MTPKPFGKDLATGSYDLLVLDALRTRPAYGYEIIRRVFEQSRHTIRWHTGTVYKVLRDLERRGAVTSAWHKPQRGHPRRYYRLTARGRRVWRTERVEWQRFSRVVNTLLGLG